MSRGEPQSALRALVIPTSFPAAAVPNVHSAYDATGVWNPRRPVKMCARDDQAVVSLAHEPDLLATRSGMPVSLSLRLGAGQHTSLQEPCHRAW